MPLDPRISLGVQVPQFESPVNMLGQMYNLQNAARQNQLAQMQMAEYERARAEEEGVRNYLAGGADVNTEAGRRGLLQYGKTGLDVSGKLTEQQSKTTEMQSKQIDQLLKSVEMHGRIMGTATAENWPEVRAKLMGLPGAKPDHFPETYPGDEKIKSEILQSMSVKEQLERVKPNPTVINAGGYEVLIDTNPNSPTFNQEIGRVTKTLSPDKAVELKLANNEVANVITDESGKTTFINKYGKVIEPSAPVKGKPSATFEKTREARKQLGMDIDRTLSNLGEITKDGGLIDQSTGSGAGRLADISAAFVGKATPGAIAIARLKPIADMVLKMVPRFEGPQSDKDTQSYKEAAGQLGDPTMPTEIRKQAAKEIMRIMKERKDQFTNTDMEAQGLTKGSTDTIPAGGRFLGFEGAK